MQQCSKNGKWLGMALILAVGTIHVIDAPDCFEEALYKGWLFYANGAGALLAAYGIFKEQCWGWGLGFLIAVGSLTGYIASRTVGLPMIPAEPDAWLEPLGVASLIVETLFVALVLKSKLKKCGEKA